MLRSDDLAVGSSFPSEIVCQRTLGHRPCNPKFIPWRTGAWCRLSKSFARGHISDVSWNDDVSESQPANQTLQRHV